MTNKLFFIFILIMLSMSVVNSMAPQQLDQQPSYNCSSETNPLEIKIIELSDTVNETQGNLSYYMNLSEYYKSLYESKEINVTHRELIQIYNTLNNFEMNLNQTNENITKLGDKFSLFTLEVGFSVLGISAVGSIIGASLIELVIKWKRRRRHEPSTN